MTDRIRTGEQVAARLLSRDEAAAYCGMSGPYFDEHIRPTIKPLQFGIRKTRHGKKPSRVLWDIRDLDAAIDRLKGFAPTLSVSEQARAAIHAAPFALRHKKTA